MRIFSKIGNYLAEAGKWEYSEVMAGDTYTTGAKQGALAGGGYRSIKLRVTRVQGDMVFYDTDGPRCSCHYDRDGNYIEPDPISVQEFNKMVLSYWSFVGNYPDSGLTAARHGFYDALRDGGPEAAATYLKQNR